MGQGSSQPERRLPDGPSRRPSVLRRALQSRSLGRSQDGLQDGLLRGEPRRYRSVRGGQSGGSHNSSRRRLSHLFHSSDRSRGTLDSVPEPEPALSGPALLHRTRSRFHEMLRRDSVNTPRPSFLQHRPSYVRYPEPSHDGNHNDEQDDDDDDNTNFFPPRLPSIDISSNFDHESLAHHSDSEPAPRTGSSHRRHSMRLNALRPDRPFRHLTSSLRRRRSPPSLSSIASRGTEDQAAMLSRLLSVAAAATAATLMGGDPRELAEARSLAGGGLGDLAGGGEDGSFDGFLRALENGRIASALRQSGSGSNGHTNSNNGANGNGGGETEAGESGQGPPLNFFRMFRFGTTNASGSPVSRGSAASPGSTDAAGNSEGRLVPIIIVGIRSISPGANGTSPTEDLPLFIDALGQVPTPLPPNALGAHAHDSIDSILRPPQNGTSFRHRRRASMGAFGSMSRNRVNDRPDDQREHRSPDQRRERPWSVASSSSTFEPRPPPATPASPSPELSRIPSRSSTPAHSRPTSVVANSVRDFSTDSRRNSILHRAPATSPLSSHTEESGSIHSTHSATNLLDDSDQFRAHRRSDTSPNIHYPRFASGHPRRNGVVEPDHLPALSRASTDNGTDSSSNNDNRNGADSRSWIIYVLGGSYPENHPILTTPSLFTENPTYEDMVLLSALLGPAKAPVATEEDVQNAGGVYEIREATASTATTSAALTSSADAAKTAQLVAAAVEGHDCVPLEPGQRCLVCLCDFEVAETTRRLAKCSHLFHKECIDQWLTTGRNSCPLCREQGVDQTPDAAASPAAASSSEDPSGSGHAATATAASAPDMHVDAHASIGSGSL